MNIFQTKLCSSMRKRPATASGTLPTRPSRATGLASLMLCGVADAYATLTPSAAQNFSQTFEDFFTHGHTMSND